MSSTSPEIPCINTEMGVSCGPSRNGGEWGKDVPAVWLTIRNGGKNTTGMLSLEAAAKLQEQIGEARGEAE